MMMMPTALAAAAVQIDFVVDEALPRLISWGLVKQVGHCH
jgi:hypothetical protein